MVALMRHVVPEHANQAARWLDQAHDHTDRRRLAGTIAAKQPRRRTNNEREGERSDGDGFAICLAKAFDGEGGVRRGKRVRHMRSYYRGGRCGKRRVRSTSN
jgi:hypothetical protein